MLTICDHKGSARLRMAERMMVPVGAFLMPPRNLLLIESSVSGFPIIIPFLMV